MDRNDPNTWTNRYVTKHLAECVAFLQETTTMVIGYVSSHNYQAAVAGLDRVINGMLVILNAKLVDCRSEIGFLSWCEASIIAFGLEAPESKRQSTALAMFEDAHDFVTKPNTKEILSNIISALQEGISLEELQEYVEPNFPEETLDILEKMRERLS